jgi:hypothetical protein
LRRLRKLACNGNQDIGHAAVLELVHDPHPELRALGLLDPYPEDFLGAIRQDAERDVNRLVAHEALIPDLDPDRVEEHQRVAGIERPTLPFADRLQYGVGHSRDQVRRYVETVKLLQVPADLAYAHPACIHRDDLRIEVREAALIPGDQLGIECARTVIQRHPRRTGQHRLSRRAVATIASADLGFRFEMVVQFSGQHSFRQRLLQLIDQAVLGE